MALTGLPQAPLGPPERLVEAVEDLARPFGTLDALALLGERAEHMGLWRRGTISCGGSCHLVAPGEGDGYLAVSLARDEDFESIPAWLELDRAPANAPRHGRPSPTLSRPEISTSSSRGPRCWGCPSPASAKRRDSLQCPDCLSVPRRRESQKG